MFFAKCRASAFTVFALLFTFWDNAELLLLPFYISFHFSGNAELLLLPFCTPFPFFGQRRASAFTVLHSLSLFWGMQRLCLYRFALPFTFSAIQSFCFYRFALPFPFSGNGELLLLPFCTPFHFFGECRASVFTVLHSTFSAPLS